jgi:hypothetical protein
MRLGLFDKKMMSQNVNLLFAQINMVLDVYMDKILQDLSLKEKCLLLSGKNMWETTNIDRLGIPSLKTTDGSAGVRGSK